MSTNSPGQARSAWSASLPSNELPLDLFFRSGVSTIPVALVPTNGGSIRLTNPQAVQKELKTMSNHFQTITDVRAFGRGGILCRSPDQTCVEDLLKCTSFASIPVRTFIPPHLACTKGLVRGVDSHLSPTETLDKLSAAGVIAIYRCNRLVNNERIPTESVIATFVGTSCPSEIKVWPLVFRVEPLASRPIQCQNCWRFGHSAGGCKSSLRCRTCGDGHPSSECSAQSENCCLCGGTHPADYSNCSARAQETQILEVIDRRRCSRRDAIAVVKDRAFGYSGVTARNTPSMNINLSEAIDAAVEKAMTKAMDKLVSSLSECLAQIISSQMIQMLQATKLQSSVLNATPRMPSNDVEAPSTFTDHSTDTTPPIQPGEGESSSSDSLTVTDMELDARAPKRMGSPISKIMKPKPKKSQPSPMNKESFLKAAVAAAVRSTPLDS